MSYLPPCYIVLSAPLLLVGASAGELLPRAGAWMDAVKQIFGVLLLGIAISLGGGYHVFGTDKVGQDVLYQVLKSVRTALVIGLAAGVAVVVDAIGRRRVR